MKVYTVSVGSLSKKGNFIEHLSVVVQSEMHYTKLKSHLDDKYKGFTVSLTEVVTIQTISSEDNGSKEGVVKSSSMSLNIRSMNFPEEIQKVSSIILEKREELKEIEKNYEALVHSHLQKTLPLIYSHIASLKLIWQYGVASTELVVRLTGEISDTLNTSEDG